MTSLTNNLPNTPEHTTRLCLGDFPDKQLTQHAWDTTRLCLDDLADKQLTQHAWDTTRLCLDDLPDSLFVDGHYYKTIDAVGIKHLLGGHWNVKPTDLLPHLHKTQLLFKSFKNLYGVK